MSKVKYIVLLFCVACATVGYAKPRAAVLNFDNSIASDASYEVYAALSQLSGGENITLSFEKGEYNFYPDYAGEEYCHISNHNDVLSRIAFNIKDLSNVTIEGNGSKFIFHGLIIPFKINGSSDVTIRNLSIDWDAPFQSEVVVVARDEDAGTFDVEIPAEYPYEIRNEQLMFLKPYFEHTVGQSILFDPELNATAFNTEAYTPITSRGKIKGSNSKKLFSYPYPMDNNEQYIKERGSQNTLKATEIEPGVVRLAGHRKLMPQVGMVLACKGEQGYNRFAPALQCVSSQNVVVEDVTVHNACGMGFLFENSENLTLDDCKVIPSEGRYVSATADASHFVGCRGFIHLNNCEFRNQLDDAMNVHGAYQQIMKVLDKKRLGVRVGHFQQKGFVVAKSGDALGLVRLSDSFFPYSTLTVDKVERVNSRYCIITLREELPEGIQQGDLVENVTAYPEVLVENSYFGGNRARGLLISTPKRTVVRNNTFSTEMEAILVPVESSFWFESGGVADLVITNNIFENSQTAGFKRGIIRFVTDDDNANTAFKSVEISNNTFNQFDSMILEASNVDGLIFKGNKIKHSDKFPSLYPDMPAFTLKHSHNVIFENNDYRGVAPKLIEYSEDMTPVIFK